MTRVPLCVKQWIAESGTATCMPSDGGVFVDGSCHPIFRSKSLQPQQAVSWHATSKSLGQKH